MIEAPSKINVSQKDELGISLTKKKINFSFLIAIKEINPRKTIKIVWEDHINIPNDLATCPSYP